MGMGEELPWLTEHIGILYMAAFGMGATGLSGTVVLGISGNLLARRSPSAARIREQCQIHIPLLGWLRQCRREARITRQLGTLLEAGLTLPRALELSAASAPDLWERAQLEDFRTRLLMGSGFEEAIEAFPIVHELNRPLLQAGQDAGRLDNYLLQVAGDLDEQVRERLSIAIRFLEPAMLLILSMAIGGLVLAYLLPMIRMLEQLA